MGLIGVAMQIRLTQNKLTMLPTKLLCCAKLTAPLSDFDFKKKRSKPRFINCNFIERSLSY